MCSFSLMGCDVLQQVGTSTAGTGVTEGEAAEVDAHRGEAGREAQRRVAEPARDLLPLDDLRVRSAPELTGDA